MAADEPAPAGDTRPDERLAWAIDVLHSKITSNELVGAEYIDWEVLPIADARALLAAARAAPVSSVPDTGPDDEPPRCTCGHTRADHRRGGCTACRIRLCGCAAWERPAAPAQPERPFCTDDRVRVRATGELGTVEAALETSVNVRHDDERNDRPQVLHYWTTDLEHVPAQPPADDQRAAEPMRQGHTDLDQDMRRLQLVKKLEPAAADSVDRVLAAVDRLRAELADCRAAGGDPS